jgi:hypothetical protein
MSDDDPERSSFEDVARVLADEVSRAIERLSEIDVEEIARAATAETERAKRWIDELGRSLREPGDAIGNALFGAGKVREHGPAPVDRPTRGRPVEPGTSALAVHGEGPRAQRRARARPRASSSRLDDRRGRDHAGRPQRAETVARRRGSSLTTRLPLMTRLRCRRPPRHAYERPLTFACMADFYVPSRRRQRSP